MTRSLTAVPANDEPHSGVSPARSGFTVLLTGLSGSGKSTLAASLAARISAVGRTVTLLDGDHLRRELFPDLGFSREDRIAHCRRAGFLAAEITRHGGVAICALVAPFRESRDAIRQQVHAHGRFVMVYVATPLAACAARDPKGLYRDAQAGIIRNLTGVGQEFEPPTDADLEIDTAVVVPNEATDDVYRRLEELGCMR